MTRSDPVAKVQIFGTRKPRGGLDAVAASLGLATAARTLNSSQKPKSAIRRKTIHYRLPKV